jgi:hypothetical protein
LTAKFIILTFKPLLVRYDDKDTKPRGYISKTGVEGVTSLIGPNIIDRLRKSYTLGGCNKIKSCIILSVTKDQTLNLAVDSKKSRVLLVGDQLLAILLVILRESKWTTEESDYGVHPVDAKIVEEGFKPVLAVLPVGQVFNPTDPFQEPVQDR